MNTIAISQARATLPNLVDKVSKTLEKVFITVKGQPKAAVISVEELESLEETAEILAIPGALESIKRGEKDIKAGRGMPLSNLPSFHEIIPYRRSD